MTVFQWLENNFGLRAWYGIDNVMDARGNGSIEDNDRRPYRNHPYRDSALGHWFVSPSVIDSLNGVRRGR